MAQALQLLAPFVAGLALGAIHFTGLWVVLRRLSVYRHPLRALIVSFLVRTSLIMSGFYLVMNGGIEQLVAALAGFILTREILRHCLGGGISSS